MPLTATIAEIKSYLAKLEKNKITPDNLKPCPRCNLESNFFKPHAYRDRCFLLIVDMFVKSILCPLIRFYCPCCGKTFTNYPDFALPYKHYTRQTIVNFSSAYVEDDQKTYATATMTEDGVPEYSDSGKPLAPSTIHRWITTLADLYIACYKNLAAQKPFYDLFMIPDDLEISHRKYKTLKRKKYLMMCRCFLRIEPFLNQFSPSSQ